MTNEQILKKAIEKAYPPIKGICQCQELLDTLEDLLEFDHAGGLNHYCLIFSHSFAKAFCGEDYKQIDFDEGYFIWQYHLQAMVLELEPLKYLERFL